MATGRKESILDLKFLVDKQVRVKLAGGREGETPCGVRSLVLGTCGPTPADPGTHNLVKMLAAESCEVPVAFSIRICPHQRPA